MAPPIAAGDFERDLPGYWGPVTATIDWCEANYQVTYYVAEFWNTISNLSLIILPIYGMIFAIKDGLEQRFTWGYFSVLVVGLGSWCFHGTLLYEMQLLDELPMIWGSSFLLYSLAEVDGRPGGQNRYFRYGLFIYCLIVTVVYLTIKEPIFHEVAYALMVFSMIAASIRTCRKFEHNKSLFLIGFVSYGTGFVLWNLDNVFCPQIRATRSSLPPPLQPLLQGHAWWHILTGFGTHLSLLFSSHSRNLYLKKKPVLKIYGGVIPVIRVLDRD